MGFSPKVPKVPPTPPAANPPTLANAGVQSAGAAARQGAATSEGMGFAGTVDTSPQGLKPNGDVAAKSLLGQ